jgi:hypothetical protein
MRAITKVLGGPALGLVTTIAAERSATAGCDIQFNYSGASNFTAADSFGIFGIGPPQPASEHQLSRSDDSWKQSFLLR